MIDATLFNDVKDIYVSPDPQGHRPTWIWFALVDGDMYIRAGGTTSTWWQSAIQYQTGKIIIENKTYAVRFQSVVEDQQLEQKILESYHERYHSKVADEGYKQPDVRLTNLKVIFIGESK
ncbi:MAG TPA: DUF2255 family protein [Lactobacillaceae bacterium]|jgi:hypothetical protein